MPLHRVSAAVRIELITLSSSQVGKTYADIVTACGTLFQLRDDRRMNLSRKETENWEVEIVVHGKNPAKFVTLSEVKTT